MYIIIYIYVYVFLHSIFNHHILSYPFIFNYIHSYPHGKVDSSQHVWLRMTSFGSLATSCQVDNNQLAVLGPLGFLPSLERLQAAPLNIWGWLVSFDPPGSCQKVAWKMVLVFPSWKKTSIFHPPTPPHPPFFPRILGGWGQWSNFDVKIHREAKHNCIRSLAQPIAAKPWEYYESFKRWKK